MLLKELHPFALIEIENDHVIELLSYIKNATEDDHVLIIDGGSVATSCELGSLISHIMLLVQIPGARGETEGPDIIQLLIFFILSTEDDKPIFIDNRRVTGSGRRAHQTLGFNDLPLLGLKVESEDLVSVDAINKTSENNHRISSIKSC
jgi:predicted transcriptional regulator